MAKVVVGLSGGVDSSVAAYLLKEQGHEVIGLFMRNWHDESVTLEDECPWIEDSADAMLVAEKLQIPFQVVDMSADYKERIVNYMFNEYEMGRTPNPDVLCNREIKFDVFLKYALRLGADFVATGHYCRKDVFLDNKGNKHYRLLEGLDKNKDQSYFLCQLSQAQLATALFPIGGLQKADVRKIAKEQNLITAEKKDSQGLCFIGKVKLPDFLQQQLKPKLGDVILLNKNLYHPKKDDLAQNCAAYCYAPTDGHKIGTHNGAHFYTVGQRKGLNIGGFKAPLFVVSTNAISNCVFVAEGENNPILFRNGLEILNHKVHWVREDYRLNFGESLAVELRIRYRQPLIKGHLFQEKEKLFITFDQAQKGVSPGQFAVWYIKGEVIGSGEIF